MKRPDRKMAIAAAALMVAAAAAAMGPQPATARGEPRLQATETGDTIMLEQPQKRLASLGGS